MNYKSVKKLIEYDEKIKSLYYAMGMDIGYDEGYSDGFNAGKTNEENKLKKNSKSYLNKFDLENLFNKGRYNDKSTKL